MSRPRGATCSTSRLKTSSTTCARSVRKRLTAFSTAVDRRRSSVRQLCFESLVQLARFRKCCDSSSAAYRLWWLVLSCSSRLRRGKQVELFEKLKGEVSSNNANVSVSATLETVATGGTSCRVAELILPQRSPCFLP